ncbi:putative mitochondrial division protein 1 [Rosellinia necatrix]|uniref:Mitochondrial division protein 1 n=1 Tax=Rosellinia necatrix TaxID=77044 RepID=A0A1W2TAS3_ROSNE|nr:putative mitochondrial division protein 1 [Rosellinia necatrix]
MDDSDLHNEFHDEASGGEESILSTRGIETFARKVTTTASHLAGHGVDTTGSHYHSAMGQVHKQLARPAVQKKMFSMTRTTPTDLVRSKFSTAEIQSRALAYLSDDMLQNIPEDENAYSLFQGFQASFPEMTEDGKRQRRRSFRGRRLIEDTPTAADSPQHLHKLKKGRSSLLHELEMLGIRKNMATSEVREIDMKIANLTGMRRIILDRLAGLEQEEALLEHDIVDMEGRIEVAQELVDEAESLAAATAAAVRSDEDDLVTDQDVDEFMSKSIYEKIPLAPSAPTRRGRQKTSRRKSMPVLHEHFEPGFNIRDIKAHADQVTAIDFDMPFGTLVSASLDDTVKVWDLNAGRCIGLLEGHTASVRALQVQDNVLVTGSADATVRLWDLSKAHYDPQGSRFGRDDEEDDGMAFENPDDQPVDPPAGSMADCPMFVLQSHVDEITALHLRGEVLVSGSSDKTLRQWDLEKGRCIQTLDVMWAAAQASASLGSGEATWRQTSRQAPGAADFVGALQVFESALACGTADGMVRLWDLRSGQVHRSLVGHTGPVTCLQFDDVHIVTGSLDRSIRIWDLRTGSIFDAYAYDNPVTSMMFDNRRIASAACEDVVKVYDKMESRQWDCGAGITETEDGRAPAIVEHVRIKDGYMVEGRRDGIIGAWAC